MRNKSVFFGGGVILILISVLNTAYAKSDLLLAIPPLLAASQSTDHIAGCYSGNFTDNCLGNNVNGIIGVALNADRSFSTVSIFGVKSSGKLTKSINNTYSGTGQTDATGCGSYDITCTDLGYSISCNYKYANGKTGTIPNANAAQCMAANQFLIQSLAGSWTFPQPFNNLYLNINTVRESRPGSGYYFIDGCDSAGNQITVSYISDTYTYHLPDPECPGGRYCPWFEFNYIGTNNIEGRHCYSYESCYPFYGDRFSPTVSILAAARSDHTATLFADGRVLVAGGHGYTNNNTINSTVNPEIYYPGANIWALAKTLIAGRSNHTATLLADGRVLVVGGSYSGAFLNSAELYDPSTNTWSAAGNLAVARGRHTAILLPDGRILVAGGSNSSEGYLNSAELYDPATNTWSAAGNLAAARDDHTATLLPDDRVLVAGGSSSTGYLNSAELYDPATNTWSAAGNLTAARGNHTATMLPDGRVLVAGGYGYSSNDVLSSAELYDPASNSWSAAGTLAVARSAHTATLLPDGRVLIVGGNYGAENNSAELYDPAANIWSAAGSLTVGRWNHTATLLPDGQVLVTGGQGWMGPLAITELYDPASDSWSLAGNLAAARVWNTATLLPDGESWLRGAMAVRDNGISQHTQALR